MFLFVDFLKFSCLVTNFEKSMWSSLQQNWKNLRPYLLNILCGSPSGLMEAIILKLIFSIKGHDRGGLGGRLSNGRGVRAVP